jgi:DnaJ-class molecular chaperone
MKKSNNYYDVLEVPTDATIQEIHTAFEKAKNSYAGDSIAMYSLLSPEESEKILEEIEEAYSIIGIPEKRLAYDRAKGLNQQNTQEGFIESFNSKPKSDISKTIETPKQTNQVNDSHEKTQEFTYKKGESKQAAVARVQVLKKFGLDYKVDEQKEQKIDSCEIFNGETLKDIREYKNVTIERMAEMTRVSKTYIRFIEEDAYEKLPALVYSRGFVYQYAKCLKLNPELVAASYVNLIKEHKDSV